MAKVLEEHVIVRVSKLVKDHDDTPGVVITGSELSTIEEAIIQIVDDPLLVVEVQRVDE